MRRRPRCVFARHGHYYVRHAAARRNSNNNHNNKVIPPTTTRPHIAMLRRTVITTVAALWLSLLFCHRTAIADNLGWCLYVTIIIIVIVVVIVIVIRPRCCRFRRRGHLLFYTLLRAFAVETLQVEVGWWCP